MSEPTVAAGFVRGLMELALSKGASPLALAERSCIDAAELQDADNRVPFAKYVALMRAGQELCHDPALALHLGESAHAETAIGCLVSGFAETGADGFALWNRYSRLNVEVECAEGGDRFVLTRCKGHLWVVDTRLNPNEFPELTELTFACLVCAARRAPGGGQFVKAVHVTHATPVYRAEYERVFQVPVVFESDRNALLTDAAWLTRSNPVALPYVCDVLSAHAESLLQCLENSKTTKGRVEDLLARVLHTGEASVDGIASKLGLSRQTLFRRLKAERTTFEQVLDELRHRMSLHYLLERQLSVNETAYLLGYSDRASFSRAFKRWTGASPHVLRASKVDAEQAALQSSPALQ